MTKQKLKTIAGRVLLKLEYPVTNAIPRNRRELRRLQSCARTGAQRFGVDGEGIILKLSKVLLVPTLLFNLPPYLFEPTAEADSLVCSCKWDTGGSASQR
jgi:hypothetical protein